MESTGSAALILFVKNPLPGRVKTRIAATAGNEKALEIYQFLLHRSLKICIGFTGAKYIYFSNAIDPELSENRSQFQLRVQSGQDLGQRMSAAMEEVHRYFSKVLLIGSDCPYLRLEDLHQAIRVLETRELVIGPAGDGGYYLIGTRHWMPELFENIPWSTSTVLKSTEDAAKRLGHRIGKLRLLWDIDTWTDWIQFKEHQDGFVNR